MENPDQTDVLMIMLCIRCTPGGAEKRYARVFEMLSQNKTARHCLVISRPLWSMLQDAGILRQCGSHLIVLAPPGSRYGGVPAFLRSWVDAVWYVYRCLRILRQTRPRVVHPLLAGTLFSLPALLMAPQVRVVASAYTSSESSPFAGPMDRQFLGCHFQARVRQFMFRRCHVIDALSDTIRKKLIARGIRPEKIMTAPGSFTDTAVCDPAPRKKPWVVFVGRFIPTKNPLLLVAAIPRVLAAHPDVQFFFLGTGLLQKSMISQIHQLGIGKQVNVRFDPRPVDILNQSSVFVSLQTRENYPSQSLLEAMACANAVVATDVGETRRLVDARNGVRIPLDADALAQAIIALMDDPDLAGKQQASRDRILTHHTPARFFDYMDRQVYGAAVRSGAK